MCPSDVLVPRIKMFVKDSIKFVPCLNIALWGAGYLFVSRKWQTDKPYVREKLNPLLTDQMPYLVMYRSMISLCGKLTLLRLHPEGSRVNEEKLVASQAFAREHNLPILHHILTPRVRGFVMTCTTLRHTLRAVYGTLLFIHDSVITTS